VVCALASAIDQFASMSAAEKNAMSSASWEFARTCTWPARAEAAELLYREISERKAE